ncbi:MAG TPA: hypothetical protein VE135_03545 [Pyrinomonadaceae bacterium]|nr:hypothetical protein [Pyrinomonadaceae bacterium]
MVLLFQARELYLAAHYCLRRIGYAFVELAERTATDVLHGDAFDLSGQIFNRFGIAVVEMNSQDVLARLIFFDTDTGHARLTKQTWRVSSLYLANLLFFSDSASAKLQRQADI